MADTPVVHGDSHQIGTLTHEQEIALAGTPLQPACRLTLEARLPRARFQEPRRRLLLCAIPTQHAVILILRGTPALAQPLVG